MHLSSPNGKPHFFKSKEQETLVCTILTGLVFIGALIYELFYIEKLPLMFDEFQYLFKGDQFIKDIYSPYQEYGFYMNKMPIPFYLFGLAQQVGGIGLRTGRLFSIIAAFSTIFVYWKITSRLAGKWAGLFIALAFVINPSLMGIYSLADSQAMSAFFFAVCLWIIAIEAPKPVIVLMILTCLFLPASDPYSTHFKVKLCTISGWISFITVRNRRIVLISEKGFMPFLDRLNSCH